MCTIKRAFLYVTRKKGKSILLFFVLLIMATFVLSGISIERAVRLEQKKLRQTMGGTFELLPEFSESNPYFKTINDDEGGVTLYTERPLTQEMIELILQMDGIKSCDADTQSNVWPDLEIFKGNVPLKGGFYEILKPDSAFENIATYEKIENQIFVDHYTLQELFRGTPVGFVSAKFLVDDPANLERNKRKP